MYNPERPSYTYLVEYRRNTPSNANNATAGYIRLVKGYSLIHVANMQHSLLREPEFSLVGIMEQKQLNNQFLI